MKKIIFFIYIISSLYIVFYPSNSYALGVGMYGTVDFGYNRYSGRIDNAKDLVNTTHQKYNGGIIIDSAVSKNTFFNYRSYIGFGISKRKFSYTYETDLIDMMIINNFTFGVIRTWQYRFYIGPQITLGYSWGDLKGSSDGEIQEASFLFGPVFGINVHVGYLVSLSFDFGCRFGYVYGLPSHPNFSDTLHGFTVEAYLNIGVIFRINDQFEHKSEKAQHKRSYEDYKGKYYNSY